MVISRTRQDQGISNPGFLGQDFAEYRDPGIFFGWDYPEIQIPRSYEKSRGNPFQLINLFSHRVFGKGDQGAIYQTLPLAP